MQGDQFDISLVKISWPTW